MQVELKSNDLKAIIFNRLNKKETNILNLSDLEQIEDIAINHTNLLGKETDILISELIFLKNLKSCIISNFQIDKNNIDIIGKLEKLECIQFTKCNFTNIDTQLQNHFKQLILEACINVDYATFARNEDLEILKIVNNNVNIKDLLKINSVKQIYLQHCNISNIKLIGQIKELEILNLSRSQIDNESILKKLEQKIKIEM